MDDVLVSASGMNLLSVFRAMRPHIPTMRPLIKKNCEGSMLCTRVFQQTTTVPILLAMATAPPITADLSWLCISFGATKPFYDTPALNSAFNWVCLFNTLVQKWEDHTTRCYECRKMQPFLESMAAVADAFPAARGFVKRTSMIKWHAVLSQISSEIGCDIVDWVSKRHSSGSKSPSSVRSSSSSSKTRQGKKSTESTTENLQQVQESTTASPDLSSSPVAPSAPSTPTKQSRGRPSRAVAAAAVAAKKSATPFHYLVARQESETPVGTSTGASAVTPLLSTPRCDLCGQPAAEPTALSCTCREHRLCPACRDGVLAAAACLPVPLCPLCPNDNAVIDIDAEMQHSMGGTTSEESKFQEEAKLQKEEAGASALPKELQDELHEMAQLVTVMQGTKTPRRRRSTHRSGAQQQAHIDRCTAALARTLHQMPAMTHTACWSAARRCLGLVDALIGMYGNPGLL